mgnify:CR=1 FL=1
MIAGTIFRHVAFSILALGAFSPLTAQTDSLKIYELNEFRLSGFREQEVVVPLANTHKTFILGGRKSEVISLLSMPANLAEKTGRQIFAKIPSGLVYDMDGSGNQVNFAVRGLDAHRSWEFNVRQNGTIINTDIYGYPASHYSMPMEAVDRIELIRGTAALQYGQQFGGMLNYVLKGPDTTKVFSFENHSSVGSFGLFASYNAIGGKAGKFTYHAYYHKRVSEGYRDHAASNSDAQYVGLSYDFNRKLSLRGELSRSTYLYRIPGPLTDPQFAENPRQATRLRNYYTPEIFIPALTLNWVISPQTRLEWIASGAFGSRSSVTFDGFANVPDVVNPETHEFAPRNVDIDNYHSRTTEARVIHHYQMGRIRNNITGSIRYFNNIFDRRQRGKGTTGFDFDLSSSSFARDITLHSQSISAALENQFFLNEKLSITPGLRYEYGHSDMTGRIDNIEADKVPRRIPYNFVTLGAHAAYQVNPHSRLYGGFSQANRPVLFQDLIPGDPLARINEDLEDSFGYNAELGWENSMDNRIKYNVTLFRVYIGNRIGNLLVEEDGQVLVAKSNIGNSLTDGIEVYFEMKLLESSNFVLSAYTSTSYINGRYISGQVRSGENNVDISGNKIEAVPTWISRNGLSGSFGTVTVLLQHQFVDDSFADAINTPSPPATGAVGLVPSYHVWDLNLSWSFLSRFTARAGVNNLMDKSYFTKRPQMYPGPGIWSSDGRGFVFSLNVKI